MNLRIGQIIKLKLDIPDAETIRYEVHKDSSSRTGSVVKPKIILPAKETNISSSVSMTTSVTGGAGAAASFTNKELVVSKPAPVNA